jgi:hypothetical protein
LNLAADADLSAAVIDYKIGDANSSALCWLLKDRRIPFLIYTGYAVIEWQWLDVPVIQKPAMAHEIATAVATLVRQDVSNRGQLMEQVGVISPQPK